jgi:hypothetical protein
MGILTSLASLMGVEFDSLLQRLKESAVVYAAIGILALVFLVFLLVAVNTALTWWVGPLYAPLIIAGAALVIAAILFVALRIQLAAQKKAMAERRVEAEGSALLTSAAISLVPQLLASPTVRSVGLPLALYAGMLLMMSPKRRP